MACRRPAPGSRLMLLAEKISCQLKSQEHSLALLHESK